MKSNKNSGAGKLKYSIDNGSTWTYLVGSSSSGSNFNTSDWYGDWSQSYVNVSKTSLNIECGASNVIFMLEATAKSLYCQSYKLTYESSKTASDLTITNSENTINLAIGGTTTGDITYTTSSDGTMSFASNNTAVATVDADGTVTAVAEGSTTITVSQAEGTSYAASSNLTVYVNVSDTRTAVGSITAISPTTVYIGETGSFTLTESLTGTVSSYAWSLGDGEDEYLTLADEVYEGLAEGNVTVTVTATPTDASTYKPVTESFPVSVKYKYAAPSLPAAAVFFSTKSITIPAIAGADIYYTLDGSTPTKSSTKYTAAFELSATKTVKAIAIDEDGLVSPVASATYTKEDVLDIAGNTIEFDATTVSFADGKTGYNDGKARTGTITNSGETKTLNISGSNIMKNSGIQFKNSGGTMTTQWIQNGGKTLSITPKFSNSLTYVISYYDGTNSGDAASATTGTAIYPTKFPCKITFNQSSTGTPVMTKLTLTALLDPVATDVAITDPGTLTVGATSTFAYTAETEEDNTASWTSATSGVITITNAATGAYTAVGRGTSKITLTLTPDDETTYRAVTAQRTITVTAPVEVSADDVEMTYGDDLVSISATTSAGYAGTLTYASGNTSIATVDASGKVTAVAVGTTTITISAPADAGSLYTAGADKVINVTVSAPAGGEDAATATQTADDYETLTSAATGWTYTNWTTHSTYGACSTAGTAGTLVTKDYKIPEKANPCVFFEHTGKTFSTPSVACKLYVQEGDNTPVELTIPTYFAGDKYDNPYIESGDIDITAYRGKTVHFIFEYTPSTGNDGKWEVMNFGIYYDIFSVKLNGSGYATYCSEYPIDFSGASDYSAWQITDINSSNEITFKQVTGSVKGGTGLLLKGTPNAIISLTSANSTNTLGDNLLEGTLAPTYVADGTYYGLSGNSFKSINAGNVKAGKAILDAGWVTSSVKVFTFIFEDDATGIRTVETVSAEEAAQIFNLAGQRINKMQKGINIVNGKKVLK